MPNCRLPLLKYLFIYNYHIWYSLYSAKLPSLRPSVHLWTQVLWSIPEPSRMSQPLFGAHPFGLKFNTSLNKKAHFRLEQNFSLLRKNTFLIGAFINKRARLLQSLVFFFRINSKRRRFCSVCSTKRILRKRI